MPVNSQHPEYKKALPAWTRINHCLEGEDTIKLAGKIYLPALKNQSQEDYAAYQLRAVFFNATGRTHEAMLGFIFRKPPSEDFPDDSLEAVQADSDLSNVPLLGYTRQVVHSTASTGRAGTLVDWSDDEKRPYFAFYPEIAILNWKEERVGGKNRLTLLVLLEQQIYGTEADPYEASLTIRYREFRLIDGVVVSQVYEETRDAVATGSTTAPGTGTGPVPKPMGTPQYPNRRGIPLDFIPFVFHGCQNNGACVNKPPLADISSVNISQFRTSADLENGRHICGIPTPYAIGFEAEDKMLLGSSFAWTTTNNDASCGFLEFTGTGLGALEKAVEEKQAQMAALGAQLVEPKKAGVESAEAIGLKASAETSTLSRIAQLAGESMTRALKIAHWWIGSAEEENDALVYSVNSDFTSAAIQADFLTAIGNAYNQGLISKDTVFHQFQRGELFPEGWTKEDEWDAIDANPPPIPEPLPGPGGAVPPAPKPKPKPKPAA